MDWNQIWTQVILGISGIIISALSVMVGRFINSKIKNEKLKNILSSGLEVVSNGVNYIQQIYVSSLKGTSAWDKEAMEQANQKALEYIKNNLSQDMIKYLNENKKDVEEWIKEQIEIYINKQKTY